MRTGAESMMGMKRNGSRSTSRRERRRQRKAMLSGGTLSTHFEGGGAELSNSMKILMDEQRLTDVRQRDTFLEMESTERLLAERTALIKEADHVTRYYDHNSFYDRIQQLNKRRAKIEQILEQRHKEEGQERKDMKHDEAFAGAAWRICPGCQQCVYAEALSTCAVKNQMYVMPLLSDYEDNGDYQFIADAYDRQQTAKKKHDDEPENEGQGKGSGGSNSSKKDGKKSGKKRGGSASGKKGEGGEAGEAQDHEGDLKIQGGFTKEDIDRLTKDLLKGRYR